MITTNRPLLLFALLPLCAIAQPAQVWNDRVSSKVWDTESIGAWGESAWRNGSSGTASFRGQGGTITLGKIITANAVSFSGNGYVLKGASLKFAGQNPTITVSQGKTASIQCNLASTGTLTKAGEGTLKLISKSAHSLPVKLTVAAGVVQLDGMGFSLEKMGPAGLLTIAKGAKLELLGSHALGGNNLGLSTDIHVDGGTLAIAGGSQYFKRVTLQGGSLVGGGFFRSTEVSEIHQKGPPAVISCKEIGGGWGKGATLTFVVESTGSDKPGLIVTCPIRNAADEATGLFAIKKTGQGVLQLSGSNDYRGSTLISAGTVRADNPFALGVASPVTLASGHLFTGVDNLSVGSLTVSGGELRLNGDAPGAITLAPDADFAMTGGVWRVSVGDKIIGAGKGVFAVSGATIDFGGTEPAAAGDHPLLSGFASGRVEKVSFTGIDAKRWAVDLDDSGMLHVRSVTSRWVIPVAIGGALLLVAGVVVFLIRGKKPVAKKPAAAAVPPPPTTRLPPPPGA